jgi:hypothetical protein
MLDKKWKSNILKEFEKENSLKCLYCGKKTESLSKLYCDECQISKQ